HNIFPRHSVTVRSFSSCRTNLLAVKISDIVVINGRKIYHQLLTAPRRREVQHFAKPDSAIYEQSGSLKLFWEIHLWPVGSSRGRIRVAQRFTFIAAVKVKVLLFPLGQRMRVSFLRFRQSMQTVFVAIQDWFEFG